MAGHRATRSVVRFLTRSQGRKRGRKEPGRERGQPAGPRRSAGQAASLSPPSVRARHTQRRKRGDDVFTAGAADPGSASRGSRQPFGGRGVLHSARRPGRVCSRVDRGAPCTVFCKTTSKSRRLARPGSRSDASARGGSAGAKRPTLKEPRSPTGLGGDGADRSRKTWGFFSHGRCTLQWGSHEGTPAGCQTRGVRSDWRPLTVPDAQSRSPAPAGGRRHRSSGRGHTAACGPSAGQQNPRPARQEPHGLWP